MNTDYVRKISTKEAQEGYIFILKNKLSLFPPLHEEFNLTPNNSPRKVMVESYSCSCRGPDKPHEHYFIRWAGLKSGDKVKIIKDSEDYIIQINF